MLKSRRFSSLSSNLVISFSIFVFLFLFAAAPRFTSAQEILATMEVKGWVEVIPVDAVVGPAIDKAGTQSITIGPVAIAKGNCPFTIVFDSLNAEFSRPEKNLAGEDTGEVDKLATTYAAQLTGAVEIENGSLPAGSSVADLAAWTSKIKASEETPVYLTMTLTATATNNSDAGNYTAKISYSAVALAYEL